MLNFFTTIIEYIKIAFSFFLNVISGLFSAITTLVSSVGVSVTVAKSVPWFVSSSFLIALFVVIINYIIGRDNQ